jgi:hypothetical protein
MSGTRQNLLRSISQTMVTGLDRLLEGITMSILPKAIKDRIRNFPTGNIPVLRHSANEANW